MAMRTGRSAVTGLTAGHTADNGDETSGHDETGEREGTGHRAATRRPSRRDEPTEGTHTVLEEVEHWLARRSWSVTDRPLHRLAAVKHATGSTVSVVLPALDEEET